MLKRSSNLNRTILLVVTAACSTVVTFGIVRFFTYSNETATNSGTVMSPPSRERFSITNEREIRTWHSESEASYLEENTIEQKDALVDPASLPPRWHHRDKDEWQGMLVDLSMQALCGSPDGCGMAMACVNGKCGPCKSDRQCDTGEVCVLDHCVPHDNVTCRSRRDCGAEEWCVLSGYSSDVRSNTNMQALCLASSGGESQMPENVNLEPGEPTTPAPYEASDLMATAHAHLR